MSFGVETETTGFGLDLRGETIPRHAEQAEGDGQQSGRAAGIRDTVARNDDRDNAIMQAYKKRPLATVVS